MGKVGLGFLLLFVCAVSGAEPSSIPLGEAFARALAQNKALLVNRTTPEIAAAQVKVERGAFDHTVEAQLLHQKNENPTATSLAGAAVSRSEVDTANVGVRRRAPAGTEYSARFLNQRSESNSRFIVLNPNYTSNIVLEVAHPLVRGAGTGVQTARLRSAEAQEAAARLRLKGEAERTVATVERTVVELAARRQDRDVRRLSLLDAEKLVGHHRSRRQAGLSSLADIIEAESVAQLRREDLLLAERQVDETQDALRELLSIDTENPDGSLEFPGTPDPKTTPRLLEKPRPMGDLLVAAFKQRPDYLAALQELRSRDVLERLAKNQTKPRVDFVATQQYNGLGGNLGDAIDQAIGRDFHTWAVGLQVEMPVENRVARGELEQRRLEEEAARLRLEQLEDVARRELSTARRRILTNQERLDVARLAVDLAAQKLTTEEGRFREGLIPNVELLRFQEDLAAARSRAVRAGADLASSWVDLDQAVGEVLDRRGIVFDTGARR